MQRLKEEETSGTFFRKDSSSQSEVADAVSLGMAVTRDGSGVRKPFLTENEELEEEQLLLLSPGRGLTTDRKKFLAAGDGYEYSTKHGVTGDGAVSASSAPGGKTRLDSAHSNEQTGPRKGGQQAGGGGLESQDEEDWSGGLSEGLPAVAEDISEAASVQLRKGMIATVSPWIIKLDCSPYLGSTSGFMKCPWGAKQPHKRQVAVP